MASRNMQLDMIKTRLHTKIVCYGHAMPIGLKKMCVGGGIDLFDSPLFTVAQGRSVPISGESPPTLLE